jgi:hypothetical protein
VCVYGAADSPLMKNKTPIFFLFFSVCASLLFLLGRRPRRRRRLVRVASSILFSRSLFLVSIITLHTHTTRRHHRVCSRRHRWLYTYFLLRLVLPTDILQLH